MNRASSSLTLLSHGQSDEPPEWSEDVRQDHPGDTVQAPDGGAASWRPGRPGSNQGLRQLPSTSIQETRIQELPKHLPTLCHPSPLQHPVSTKPTQLHWELQTQHGCNVFLLHDNRQDVTEDDLRLLFSNSGSTVKAFKFFQYVQLVYIE